MIAVVITLVMAVALHVALGATWMGIVGATDPNATAYRELALLTLLIVCALWLFARRRTPGRTTRLDLAIALWGVAIAITFIPNMENWRRMVIGLWFTGLYTLLWYIGSDLISNGRLSRISLADGFLLAGLIPLWGGLDALVKWYQQTGQFTLTQKGILAFVDAVPRISSTLDNPNPLGTVSLLLCFIAAGRFLGATGKFSRIVFGVYTIWAGLILFAAQSRGSWLGAGAGLVALVLILINNYRVHVHRLVWIGGASVMIGVVLAVTLARGWAVEGRDIIYGVALKLFGESPIFGSGLYTFGKGLMREIGMVPGTTAHAQAHNFVLNVAAELGVIGLIALAVTVILIVRLVRDNLRQTTGSERMLVIASAAALIGFAGHHVFDVTASQPAVAIMGLVVLLIGAAPGLSSENQFASNLPTRYPFVRVGLLIALAISLLASGWWDTAIYRDYRTAIARFFRTIDARTAVESMRTIVAADPRISLYVGSEAYFLFRAGDLKGAQEAYNRFCALEPQFDSDRFDPQLVFTQMAILHYMRFSPLAFDKRFWEDYRCPPLKPAVPGG